MTLLALHTASTLLFGGAPSSSPSAVELSPHLAADAGLPRTRVVTVEEEQILQKVDYCLRRALLVVDLADGKLDPSSSKYQREEAVLLYMKALEIFRVGMEVPRAFVSNIGSQAVSNNIYELVQWVRSRFNRYLEKAEDLQRSLPPRSQAEAPTVVAISAEKIIYQDALQIVWYYISYIFRY